MPIYDFRCSTCGVEYEYNVPIESRDDKFLCFKCDAKKVENPYTLERVISFKGLTWAPTAGGMR